MTVSKSTVVRLGSLLVACALFALGTPVEAASTKKKNQNDETVPAAQQKQQQRPKKEQKAKTGGSQTGQQGHAGHDHTAPGHKGHDQAGHGHAGQAHPGAGHPGPAHPPHDEAMEKEDRKQALVLANSKKGPVVAEQRKHALRTAQLNRLRMVSIETMDLELGKLAHELLKKENTRHYKKMAQMRKTMRYQAKAARFPLQGGPQR